MPAIPLSLSRSPSLSSSSTLLPHMKASESCPPEMAALAEKQTESWLAGNCLHPMKNPDGIIVSGVYLTADSDDHEYVHEPQDRGGFKEGFKLQEVNKAKGAIVKEKYYKTQPDRTNINKDKNHPMFKKEKAEKKQKDYRLIFNERIKKKHETDVQLELEQKFPEKV